MDEAVLNLFMELHAGLPRQAPGSAASTRRALSGLGLAPSSRPLRLADMGCGPGAQTLELLQALPGVAAALDLMPEFISALRERATAAGLADRVAPLVADMARPPLPEAGCDLIWSEGAIYNIGFDQGLALWAPLLRPRGLLAVSELCWTQAAPAGPAKAFWAQNYPAMRGVQDNVRALEQAGFECLDWFELPEEDWWREYYAPLEVRLEAFATRHAGNEAAREVVAMEREEITLRRRHGQDFAYVFFTARRQE